MRKSFEAKPQTAPAKKQGKEKTAKAAGAEDSTIATRGIEFHFIALENMVNHFRTLVETSFLYSNKNSIF